MTIDKKFILSLLDLTSLNDDDTTSTIETLCQKAATAQGPVAAVCVYPEFVKNAVTVLQTSPVKVATVANFPQGTDSLENVLPVIQKAIHDGAQEIDVVFPYEQFLTGDWQTAGHFIKTCKAACGSQILLKVILETGVLKEKPIITNACEIALQNGANFIKTSTGKVAVGATLEAAEVILLAMKRASQPVGFKVSGGIRTIEEAEQFINLANQIMGTDWVSPNSFRIGASSLIDAIVTK